MPDQVEQTIQAPTANSDRRSDRDLQRVALRDLVALAGQCAHQEVEIEQKHQEELKASKDKLDKALFTTEQRAEHLKEQIRQKHREHTATIAHRFEAETAQLKSTDVNARRNIEADFEKGDSEIRHKLQQAAWLADSVLEATQNQLRDESSKGKRDHATQLELLDALENRAGAMMFSYGVNLTLLTDPPPLEVPAADAEKEVTEQRERAEQLLAQLETLSAPRLLTGPRPYLVSIGILLAAAAGAQLIGGGGIPNPFSIDALNWRGIGIYETIACMALIVVGVIVRFAGKAQAKKVYLPLRQAISTARVAGKLKLDRAHEDRENRRQRAAKRREAEVQAAKDKYAPLTAKIITIRDNATTTHRTDYSRRVSRSEEQREQARTEIDAWQAKHLDDIQKRAEHDLRAARSNHEQELAQIVTRHQHAKEELVSRWKEGLARIQAPIEGQGKASNLPRDWDDPAWKSWTPTTKFAPTTQFGQLEVNLKQLTEHFPNQNHSDLELPETFSLSALLAFPSQASLLIQHDRDGRQQALSTLQMVMTRLLTTQPAGRVRFTIIDPVGLGQNFAGFMHLADWDEALVGGRIWTSAEHIEQRLANLTEHMETVIQKYLRNEFETIDEYNAQAGELAEPYRFLVISDFPVGFNDDAIRRLNSIAASGARCGVYTLIAHDRRAPVPGGVNLDDIIAHSVSLVQTRDEVPVDPNADLENPVVRREPRPSANNWRFVWRDEVFKQFPLTLDPPPSEDRLTQLLTEVGQAAKDANRVEVSFDTIAPTEEEFWSERSDSDLHVAIGRMGATRLQMFRLGRGVAQHALIAGKTGSGKSTLLHALVTNLAMWYSPDQIEFYLVDFKKGVEFKTYASHSLPHARAIAVESDREFGLSVLQRIDAELTRRGELFRKVGVQDLASYRHTPNAQIIPRTLLVIDEFQEFFSEDDKLAQDATVLLDRLVRQGRAFGIHVLLGSQTIGGSSGLARSTIGQMAVRIALQTTEADSQLILGDNNSAARLLSRPGEAIYNDQGGLVEANSPFQIAWLPDERREVYLTKVLERAIAEKKAVEPAAVFEGNQPADIRKNRRLNNLIEEPGATQSGPPLAWVGDPVAIKDPTAIALRRQSGSNLLIVGQQEESALALVVSSMISLSAQFPRGGASFVILDGTPADSSFTGMLPSITAALPNESKIIDYRDVPTAIAELHAEMQRRLNEHHTDAAAIYLIVYGLQRYRALRKSEDSFGGFSMSDEEKKWPPDKQFSEILREGPPLGIHVITWCDTPAAVERTLERSSLREFDHRILFQMSAADSSNLIDSPAANKLGFHRALAFSEEQGTLEKFRPYAMPPKEWLEQAKARLQAR